MDKYQLDLPNTNGIFNCSSNANIIIGSANTNVLPDPVYAIPMQSGQITLSAFELVLDI